MTEDSEWFRTGEQPSAQGFERHGLESIQAPGRIGMDPAKSLAFMTAAQISAMAGCTKQR
jgi:hypothetical protein